MIRNTSGFSLMEMMVVVAIVAITSAIAIPNLIGRLPAYRLSSASSDVLSVLQNARLRAVKEFANVVVDFDVPNNKYKVFLDNGRGGGTAYNGEQDGTELTLMEKTVPNGVTIHSAGFSSQQRIEFNSQGGLYRSKNSYMGGNVELKSSAGETKKIIVNIAGLSRIEV
ncbi:MAG: prepilin-type N-terminal cleavage/methylation domain-containing protein [Desulfobacteraceae bacterium]|nr:prepilin-type N-terminal cleavage/methylation domain-containing protein [Desulfobacteraceae bacterium]